MIIDKPQKDDKDSKKATKMGYHPEPNQFKKTTGTYFPIQCGDWRSDETQQFINEMPIGTTSPNYKAGKLAKGWYYSLKDSMPKLWNYPLTHFLAICNADFRIGHKDLNNIALAALDYIAPWVNLVGERHFKGGAEPECEVLKEDIKDMTELEATFWFCYGTTTEYLFVLERPWDNSWTMSWGKHKVPTHSELCGKMRKQASPFGMDLETFKRLEDDYKAQIKTWKMQNRDMLRTEKTTGNNKTYRFEPFRVSFLIL